MRNSRLPREPRLTVWEPLAYIIFPLCLVYGPMGRGLVLMYEFMHVCMNVGLCISLAHICRTATAISIYPEVLNQLVSIAWQPIPVVLFFFSVVLGPICTSHAPTLPSCPRAGFGVCMKQKSRSKLLPWSGFDHRTWQSNGWDRYH